MTQPGAPPAQKKLLQNVVDILKSPQNLNTVDVEGMLVGSSGDKGVVKWLQGTKY